MKQNIQQNDEAVWRGEAAKAWWCNLSEKERQQIEILTPEEVFVLGWQCGRAKGNNAFLEGK